MKEQESRRGSGRATGREMEDAGAELSKSWTLQCALLLVPWEFTHVTVAPALAESSSHIYLLNPYTRECL